MLSLNSIARNESCWQRLRETNAYRFSVPNVGDLELYDSLSAKTTGRSASDFVNKLGLKIVNEEPNFSDRFDGWILIKPYRTREINIWESVFCGAHHFFYALIAGSLAPNVHDYIYILGDTQLAAAKIITLGPLFVSDFPKIVPTTQPKMRLINSPVIEEFRKLLDSFPNLSSEFNSEFPFYEFFANWGLQFGPRFFCNFGANFALVGANIIRNTKNFFNIPYIAIPFRDWNFKLDDIIVHFNGKWNKSNSVLPNDKLYSITNQYERCNFQESEIDKLHQNFFLTFRKVFAGELTFDHIIEELKGNVDFEVGFV